MTNILKEISTYDLETHTPYPTFEFILKETGEDMVINNESNFDKAKAQLRQFTDTAKDFIMSKKPKHTADYMEYLIATKEEWRMEFLRFVAMVVMDFYAGVDIFNGEMSKRAENRYNAGVLKTMYFKPYKYNYRVGY